MSLFKPALTRYFEKCGVSAPDAQRVQALFGQNYQAMVQQMEVIGSKGDSKALAAVQIADDAFFTPTTIRMVRIGVTSNRPLISTNWPRPFGQLDSAASPSTGKPSTKMS